MIIPNTFYSDPHFGHRNICRYSNRPFESVSEMNTTLINNYNKVVTNEDCCLWLGDIFFTAQDEAREILDSMHGTKILILGNHDKHAPRWYLNIGFSLVFERCVDLSICGKPARASHYPYISEINNLTLVVDDDNIKKKLAKYPNKKKGEILLHGHTHSKEKRKGNQIHVGVDAWEYCPVTLAQVEELAKNIHIR